eukprot:TRINITY_DN8906_c0_g5_i1.p2 TRINITY_DN8906_c0_g5~~TRINITY_DN8906_c0_g5_i1.p2  ORF type:complete len:188 (+),score=-14.76 TRINITY_DN8906_c0_g5_i1:1662-2225(+)
MSQLFNKHIQHAVHVRAQSVRGRDLSEIHVTCDYQYPSAQTHVQPVLNFVFQFCIWFLFCQVIFVQKTQKKGQLKQKNSAQEKMQNQINPSFACTLTSHIPNAYINTISTVLSNCKLCVGTKHILCNNWQLCYNNNSKNKQQQIVKECFCLFLFRVTFVLVCFYFVQLFFFYLGDTNNKILTDYVMF